MKPIIKSIVIFSVFAFILTLALNNDAVSQGRGKGINTSTAGGRWIDANGDGICDNFIDANGDGINDNPHGNGYLKGKGVKGAKAQGIGRFGAKSGVCDGSQKGRMNTQTTPKVTK